MWKGKKIPQLRHSFQLYKLRRPFLIIFFLKLPAACESLEINFKVSSALVEIVRRISTRPRYILAKASIQRGVTKFNVNTEVRKAYMNSLSNPKQDLVHVMASAKEAMKVVVAEKMRLFGLSGKA
ncbi:hypothetical protein OIU76_023063 [Salix suchowensis]|nr:hypothetical protein OIU76_023063 [Salix suchowensis]